MKSLAISRLFEGFIGDWILCAAGLLPRRVYFIFLIFEELPYGYSVSLTYKGKVFIFL